MSNFLKIWWLGFKIFFGFIALSFISIFPLFIIKTILFIVLKGTSLAGEKVFIKGTSAGTWSVVDVWIFLLVCFIVFLINFVYFPFVFGFLLNKMKARLRCWFE